MAGARAAPVPEPFDLSLCDHHARPGGTVLRQTEAVCPAPPCEAVLLPAAKALRGSLTSLVPDSDPKGTGVDAWMWIKIAQLRSTCFIIGIGGKQSWRATVPRPWLTTSDSKLPERRNSSLLWKKAISEIECWKYLGCGRPC